MSNVLSTLSPLCTGQKRHGRPCRIRLCRQCVPSLRTLQHIYSLPGILDEIFVQGFAAISIILNCLIVISNYLISPRLNLVFVTSILVIIKTLFIFLNNCLLPGYPLATQKPWSRSLCKLCIPAHFCRCCIMPSIL